MKKHIFAALSLLLIATMVLVACGPTPAPEPTQSGEAAAPAATQPAAESEPTAAPAAEGPKILRVRLYGDIQNLDPAFQISENDTVVANAVMDGLVRYCPNSYDICLSLIHI